MADQRGRTYTIWVCPDPDCDHYVTDAGDNPDKGGCPSNLAHTGEQNPKLKCVTVKPLVTGESSDD